MSAYEPQRRALVSGQEQGSDQHLSFVDVEAECEPRCDQTVRVGLVITLGPLPSGCRYVVAFARGRFTPAVEVADLAGPPEITASVSGLGESAFSWYLGDFAQGALPQRLVVHAVVPSSRQAREVDLVVRVDVSVKGQRFPFLPQQRLDHARAESPCTFRLVLPADPEAPVAQQVAPVVRAETDVRLHMAADIEAYSRFRNPEAARAQERFVELLRMARELAGIDEAAVRTESAGDSQYAVLPAGLDETVVVPRLLAGLERAARSVNHDLNDHARLRIRVALDRGIVTPTVNGFVGRSTITVHRLLDAPPLRAALADHPRESCAVMVSDVLFQDLVRHGYGGLRLDDFTETVVDLPRKNFSERAWLHLPGKGFAG